MNVSSSLNRRHFLQASLITAAAGVAGFATTAAFADAVKPKHDPFLGLKIGIASYTYRKFTLDQAIAFTKAAGFKYINLKDMHLPLKSTKEEREAAHKKVEAAGLILTGCGVVSLSNKEDVVRNAFEYARDAGMATIVAAPSVDSLDLVEKYAKEFDIRIAIHNHGPSDKVFPSPGDVFKAVKDRDSRMGLCIDVGHTVRINEDPVVAFEKYGSRLYDLHIKDETMNTKDGKPTELGKGVIDIVAIFKQLIKMKYSNTIGLEYEAHDTDPQPGVLESIGYMKGVLATLA